MSFPFSAVVGQDEAKLALLLNAVDPRIGGVLLRGQKGSAKTTLARGLAALLPAGAPFVELPIGATEDRLVGTLDVSRVLTTGERRFEPGLLATADGGVLYVDEINLLPDHLVDVLLDVAASGVNRVERDGMSHVHPSRFVLVGSMNPEEGELRPQLLDRFGLSAEIGTPAGPGQRSAAIRRRLAWDGDPGGERDRWAGAEAELVARLAAARPAALGEELIDAVAHLCAAMGAEGLRADLTICRAAAALAGWEGRATVQVSDIQAVAPLALGHRARRDPFDPVGVDQAKLASALDMLEDLDRAEGSSGPTGASEPAGSPEPAGASGPAGSLEPAGASGPAGSAPSPAGDRDLAGAASGPPAASSSPLPSRPPPAPPSTLSSPDDAVRGLTGTDPGPVRTSSASSANAASAARGRTIGEGARGRTIGSRPVGSAAGGSGAGVSGIGGSVALVATARAASERRGLTGESGAMRAPASVGTLVEPGDLRVAVREERKSNLVVVLVDASGSMGAASRMTAARSAVLGLLADAYQRRDQVALVSFRGEGAEVLLRPTGSVEVARARLRELPTGGRTPLAAGLVAAMELIASVERAAKHRPYLVVVTDGRATAAADGVDPVVAAESAAEVIRRKQIDAVVVDVEDGVTRLGLAARLASIMGARHLAVTELTSEGLEQVVRTGLAYGES